MICKTFNEILIEIIIGQRSSLSVIPLGYLNFKKVIFRTMLAMWKQFPVSWLTSGRLALHDSESQSEVESTNEKKKKNGGGGTLI